MIIYKICHDLELFVIIHAWSLLVEIFFKGVHLEFEKNTYSYILSMLDNSFYRLCFSKIFTFTGCFVYALYVVIHISRKAETLFCIISHQNPTILLVLLKSAKIVLTMNFLLCNVPSLLKIQVMGTASFWNKY